MNDSDDQKSEMLVQSSAQKPRRTSQAQYQLTRLDAQSLTKRRGNLFAGIPKAPNKTKTPQDEPAFDAEVAHDRSKLELRDRRSEPIFKKLRRDKGRKAARGSKLSSSGELLPPSEGAASRDEAPISLEGEEPDSLEHRHHKEQKAGKHRTPRPVEPAVQPPVEERRSALSSVSQGNQTEGSALPP